MLCVGENLLVCCAKYTAIIRNKKTTFHIVFDDKPSLFIDLLLLLASDLMLKIEESDKCSKCELETIYVYIFEGTELKEKINIKDLDISKFLETLRKEV